jgi:hypothetical protein
MKDSLAIEGDVTSPAACIKLLSDFGGYQPELDMNEFQAALHSSAAQGGQMFAENVYANEVAALDRYFAAVLSPANTPENFANLAVRLKAAEESVEKTLLVRTLIPPQAAVLGSIQRATANIRGVQCLAALKRWQLEHADAPADLSAVVKAANMPDVPLDPYSGKPLRLATVNGQPVIYSVGADGRDDQALLEWDRYPNSSGDMVFRLDAAP